jgi:hypothetical protein
MNPFPSTKRYDGTEQILSSSTASSNFQTGATALAQAARCSCMLTYGQKNLVVPALVTQSFALGSVRRVGKVFPSARLRAEVNLRMELSPCLKKN